MFPYSFAPSKVTFAPNRFSRLLAEEANRLAQATEQTVNQLTGQSTFVPPADIAEFEDRWEILIAAPGIEKEAFRISSRDSLLTISGSRTSPFTTTTPKTEPVVPTVDPLTNSVPEVATPVAETPVTNSDLKSVRREITWGEFTRTFRLPKNILTAGIQASYVNGLLTVTIPKVLEPVMENVITVR